MPLWAADDSLKAQAVAARTYALFHLRRKKSRPYQLRSDSFSQVYSGEGSRRARILTAATAGEVCTCRGRVFETFYHSTCGGATADGNGVFAGETSPALRGRDCPFCEAGESPHFSWTCDVAVAEASQALLDRSDETLRLRPLQQDSFGRWIAVLAETDVINMVSRGLRVENILKGIHLSMAGRFLKLLQAAKAEGTVALTGGLAADVGLAGALRERAADTKLDVTIVSQPDAVYAGALGAALWAKFRLDKLAELGMGVA